jgi:hypothetical protein
MKKYRSKGYAAGGMMPDEKKKKPTAGEKRQAKAEYKGITTAAPSGDAEYDKFRQERATRRDKLAGQAKMRGNSERMVDETAAYCGKDGCSQNPLSAGDSNNSSVTSGTNKQVRGGRSFQESGSGTLRSQMRQQKKADVSALAAGSRANASAYDIQRAEKVKERLGAQAAKREEMNQRAYGKKKPASPTTGYAGYKNGGKLPVKGMAIMVKTPGAGEVKKSLPTGSSEARVMQDIRSQAAYNNMNMSDTYERYKPFYDKEMAKANILDKGTQAQREQVRKDIQKGPSVYYEQVLFDVPASELKRGAKSIAKKVAKWKNK